MAELVGHVVVRFFVYRQSRFVAPGFVFLGVKVFPQGWRFHGVEVDALNFSGRDHMPAFCTDCIETGFDSSKINF